MIGLPFKDGARFVRSRQLIKAKHWARAGVVADGYHLWSERYDRQMEDIFDVQDEITLAVVEALKVKLLGNEKAVVLKRYTDNTEAYELYLKGRHFYNKYTSEGWKRAIEFFEKSIGKEPEYGDFPWRGRVARFRTSAISPAASLAVQATEPLDQSSLDSLGMSIYYALTF